MISSSADENSSSSKEPKSLLVHRPNPALKQDKDAKPVDKKFRSNPDEEMSDVVDNKMDPMNVDTNGGGGLFNNVNNFTNFNVGSNNAGDIDLSTLHNLQNNLTQLMNQNNSNNIGLGGLSQQFNMDDGTDGSFNNGGSDNPFM